MMNTKTIVNNTIATINDGFKNISITPSLNEVMANNERNRQERLRAIRERDALYAEMEWRQNELKHDPECIKAEEEYSDSLWKETHPEEPEKTISSNVIIELTSDDITAIRYNFKLPKSKTHEISLESSDTSEVILKIGQDKYWMTKAELNQMKQNWDKFCETKTKMPKVELQKLLA